MKNYHRIVWLAAMTAVVIAAPVSQATDIDAKSKTVLTKFADSFKAHKTISSDITVSAESDNGSISFAGKVAVERGDKVAFKVEGGDKEKAYFICDGKHLVIKRGNEDEATKVDAIKVEEVGPRMLRSMRPFEVGTFYPNVLTPNVYDSLMLDVDKVTHAGEETIDGVKTDHLKFEQNNFDWEIWISQDAKPRVMKLSSDFSKGRGGKVVETFKNWKYDEKLDADAFKFPAEAEKAEAKKEEKKPGEKPIK